MSPTSGISGSNSVARSLRALNLPGAEHQPEEKNVIAQHFGKIVWIYRIYFKGIFDENKEKLGERV